MIKKMIWRCGLAIGLAICVGAGVLNAAPAFVWIEGENPAAMPTGASTADGPANVLSEGKWAVLTVQPNDVETKMPAEGMVFAYPFKLAQGGKQAVWARIGYELARSPIQWRVDDGEWGTVAPDELTSDLMEVAVWNPVAWLKLTDKDLPAGDHTLEVRVLAKKNDKGKYQRVLFGLDAICITPDKFYPNGPHQPGSEWQEDVDKQAAEVVFNFPEAPTEGEAQTFIR